MHGLERLYPLFTIDDNIPKLDVAGSIPVSRSIFSISYRTVDFRGLPKVSIGDIAFRQTPSITGAKRV